MFSILDNISIDNYYKSNNLIKINKLNIENIYKDTNFLSILSALNIDDKLLIEKFPLLNLINIDNKLWHNYDYNNILDIMNENDLSIKDLYCNENLEFLQKQATVMRFFFNKINKENNNNNKLILFLTLLDFCLKTIKLNNNSLNKTIKDKILKDKDTLLKILNNDIFHKIYVIFNLYSIDNIENN